MCWEQYEKQNNKFGFPIYGLVILNFFVIASVWAIYSQAVKSRVNELEERTNKRSTQPGKKILKPTLANLLSEFSWGSFLSFYRPYCFILVVFPPSSTAT